MKKYLFILISAIFFSSTYIVNAEAQGLGIEGLGCTDTGNSNIYFLDLYIDHASEIKDKTNISHYYFLDDPGKIFLTTGCVPYTTSDKVDTLEVDLITPRFPNGFAITLTETGNNSNDYFGLVDFTLNPEPFSSKTLSVNIGDVIQAKYRDALSEKIRIYGLSTDSCTEDIDSDGIDNCKDNCVYVPNNDQRDSNNNGHGDICSVDLKLDKIEVSQVIQDDEHSVPLIDGRPTWVRAYLDLTDSPPNGARVTGVVHKVNSNPPSYASPSNGTPCAQTNSNCIMAVDSNAAHLSSTLLFNIPQSWIQNEENITLKVSIQYDRGDTLAFDPNKTNNEKIVELDVLKTRPLNIMFIPVQTLYNTTAFSFSEWHYSNPQPVARGCTIESDGRGIEPCPPHTLPPEIEYCAPPTMTDFIDEVRWSLNVFPTNEINIIQDSGMKEDTGMDLIGKLAWRNTWTIDPLSHMIYYGLVCKDVTTDPRGMGFFTGEAWSSPGSNNSPQTMAHEIGHAFGEMHTPATLGTPENCDEASWLDDNFPEYKYDPGMGGVWQRATIGFPGISPYGNEVYTPQVNRDFMSYCDDNNYWVSPDTYKDLIGTFDYITPSDPRKSDLSEHPHWPNYGEPQNSSSGEVEHIVFSGRMIGNELEYLSPISKMMLPPTNTDSQGPLSIAFVDSSENVIKQQRFGFSGIHDTRYDSFFVAIPYEKNSKQLVIIYDKDHVKSQIASINVSPNEPSVEILSPNGGEILQGMASITWEAHDPDNDYLSFDLLISYDGGDTWRSLVTAYQETRYELDTSTLPGSGNAIIKVIANDGINSGYDESNSFSIIAKKSQVEISSPKDKSTFNIRSPVEFFGTSISKDFSSASKESLRWYSDKDGFIGDGSKFVITDLSLGSHQIDLVYVTNDRKETRDSITIGIVPNMNGIEIGNFPINDPPPTTPPEELTLTISLNVGYDDGTPMIVASTVPSTPLLFMYSADKITWTSFEEKTTSKLGGITSFKWTDHPSNLDTVHVKARDISNDIVFAESNTVQVNLKNSGDTKSSTSSIFGKIKIFDKPLILDKSTKPSVVVDKINGLSFGKIATLKDFEIAQISPEVIRELNPSVFGQFTADQFSKLPIESTKSLSGTKLGQFKEVLPEITPQIAQRLDAKAISTMHPDSLQQIPTVTKMIFKTKSVSSVFGSVGQSIDGGLLNSKLFVAPLQQIKIGVLPEHVVCNDGLVLAKFISSNKSICISDNVFDVLLERKIISENFN